MKSVHSKILGPDSETLDRDVEGYLVHPEEWTREVAMILAGEESLSLTSDHWKIFEFIRDYYAEHQVAPDVRHVTTYLSKEKNIPKKEAKAFLFNCFPYGYVKQACKIAGMKKPRAWSTG